MGMTYDKMSQHFPFSTSDALPCVVTQGTKARSVADDVASLRWYRLSFASTILPAPSQWYLGDRGVKLSVEWASQIIYHLSATASQTPLQTSLASQLDAPLEPDPGLVTLLSFAIDQYFMVMYVPLPSRYPRSADQAAHIQHASSFLLGSMEQSTVSTSASLLRRGSSRRPITVRIGGKSDRANRPQRICPLSARQSCVSHSRTVQSGKGSSRQSVCDSARSTRCSHSIRTCSPSSPASWPDSR
jgi:hypothetical protein